MGHTQQHHSACGGSSYSHESSHPKEYTLGKQYAFSRRWKGNHPLYVLGSIVSELILTYRHGPTRSL
jgi:hypothetical protein